MAFRTIQLSPEQRANLKPLNEPAETGGMGGMVPGGGMNQDMIQMMAIKDLMTTGGKNISKITALKGLLAPESGVPLSAGGRTINVPPATAFNFLQKRQAEEKEKQEKLGELRRGVEILTKGQAKTGPLSGRLLQAQVKGVPFTGRASTEERELYNLLGSAKAGELFRVGGKTLPGQEIAALEPLVPEFTQPTETAISQLEQLIRKLNYAYAANQSDLSEYGFIPD